MGDASKKIRNMIILGVLSIALILGIVYFAYGYADNAQNNENWNISITGIETTNVIGQASNADEPTFEDNTATFSTNLVLPGDSITYTITVKNKGKVDATLKTITMNDPNNPLITFTKTGASEGEVLHKGESHTVNITVGFNSSATTSVQTEVNFSMNLEYEQTNPSDVVDIVVTTNWSGDTESDRPENIILHLRGSEREYVTDDSKWVKNGNTWTYTFKDMLNEHYTIYEEELSNYTSPYMGPENATSVTGTSVNITNTLKQITPQTQTITVTTNWSGDDESTRPENIKVHLIGPNNEDYPTDNSKWVKNGNTWTYTFEVPEGTYKVYEEPLEGYTGNCTGRENAINVSGDSVTITNTKNQAETQTIVITATFDTDERPDNIIVHLIGPNNEDYKTDNSKWVKNGNTWTYTFEVPKGEYKVYEENLENFTSNIMGKDKIIKVDGNVIINHKYIKKDDKDKTPSVIPSDDKKQDDSNKNSIVKIPNTLKNSIPWIIVISLFSVAVILLIILKRNEEDKDEKKE